MFRKLFPSLFCKLCNSFLCSEEKHCKNHPEWTIPKGMWERSTVLGSCCLGGMDELILQYKEQKKIKKDLENKVQELEESNSKLEMENFELIKNRMN